MTMDVGESAIFPEKIKTARFGLVLKHEIFDSQDASNLECPENEQNKYLNSLITQDKIARSAEISESDNSSAFFSILNKGELIGNIVLTPDVYGSAEINFWLADQFRGNGYATLATRALSNCLAGNFSSIYAQVDSENTAATMVLKRSGFSEIAGKETGKLIFSFRFIVSDNKDQPKDQQALTNNIEKDLPLPSRKLSLSGRYENGDWAYLSRGIGRKLYRCPCCQGIIDIGEEHTIVSLVKVDKGSQYDHHHLHSQCAQQEILPRLHGVKEILPKQTTPESMNRRRRRFKRATKSSGF